MKPNLTQDQQKIYDRIVAGGGEALRCDAWYRAGGWNVCDEKAMNLIARKGFVRIEAVGGSTFAVVT